MSEAPMEIEFHSDSPKDAQELAIDHLSYPVVSTPDIATPVASSSQPRRLLKDRIYVGNLHPTVDEYTLIQIFSKFGKISKMDYLFHKTGPLKGKPRGYAFVEYLRHEDAQKALAKANEQLLRGRKLVVTFAQQAPLDQAGASSLDWKRKRAAADANKPTTLSLLKGHAGGRSDATSDKIAMMEAKLRQLERDPTTSMSTSTSLPFHPSLPPKPTSGPAPPTVKAPVAKATAQASAKPPATKRSIPKPGPAPRSASASTAMVSSIVHDARANTGPQASHRKPALSGVRIAKPPKPVL